MNLNEAYIKAEKGNIYYTKNNDMFLSMVKSIFISNNKAVRVYYDINKGLYVFGDAFNYIHADLANGMKYHSNIYGPDEMRANVSYLRQNCALFQVLPDDDFKKYDVGDGYTDGWFLKIDDLIFACRNKQYHKVRDEVPLFRDYIGYWTPTDYYIAKKQGLTETVEEKIIAYHGSQHKKFNFRDDKVLYLTTDKKKAESYAKREWDEGLIEGEIPVVYTFEVSVKNPYVCHTENEFQCEFCDVNMNLEGGKEELIEKGYDSIKYKDLIGVFSSSQIKLVDTEVLPPSMDYYYPKDTKDGDEDINDYYYDGEELDESVQNDIDEKLNSKNNCKIVLKDGKTIYGHLLSVNENYVYINSDNGNRIKKDDIKELYIYYDCEVITKNGKTIYGNFVGDFGDHKLHLDDSFNRKGWAIKDEMIEKVNYKKVIKHTFNSEKLNESVIDGKTFYTKQLSRMLDICMNIGNARFIYISETGLFVIGNALNCTHISLFLDALQEGKFDIGDMDIDEYFDEYIHSAEDTGAIITKEYANDKNIWMKSPDSTNVINDYGKFYLCNGLCIEDSLAELTNIKPKYISYLDESVNNKPKLITAYRGIDSDKFKFKNGAPQWFSSCEGIAKSFGDIIYEAKLKLNNPADLTNDKELYIILKDMIKEYEESYRSRYNQIRGYLVDYIKETYPDFDISDIDDNTLISLSKQLKDVPYNIEHYIWIFNELNIILDCISKQESWAGLFHKYIYPNWDRVIKTVQEQGYDSIISLEETSNRSYIDIGYVIWNNENIVSIKKISKNINESVEDKILYIIRGVPGSGKSTLAHKLTDNVVEADQYFYDDEGNYNWSADKLNQAHNWCFYTVKKYMEEGRDKIAVANTFVKNRDYKRYVELAKEFGYKVDIRTCTGNYQNIHNVPDETVEKMRSKFQETPLNESIAYVSKKDLSDIILKNPTRKELKDNGLEFCRYMFEDDNTYYFADAKEYSHLDLAQLFLDVFKNYNLHTDGGYYSVKENCFYIRNDFGCEKNKERLDNTKLLHKLFGNFKSIIYEGDYPEGYSKELDESAENDKTLRDYAVKLANICLDALVKTKYETKISKEQVQINVDKAFKKAVPMLKNSPYEYFIILVSKNDELYASYGKTVDRKYGLITLPVFSKDPIDQTLSILYKHKSLLNKIYSTYSGDELKLKINEYAIKYLKKELEKSLSNVKSEYIDILIHECTHLLDDVRRTKTYNKSKEQNLKDDKGIETYYNSPEEQNAYYQETVSIFDEYAENKLVGYKTFDIFWDDFIRQYRGEYNMLNDKNKRKLKKRAYAYWYVYMKD